VHEVFPLFIQPYEAFSGLVPIFLEWGAERAKRQSPGQLQLQTVLKREGAPCEESLLLSMSTLKIALLFAHCQSHHIRAAMFGLDGRMDRYEKIENSSSAKKNIKPPFSSLLNQPWYTTSSYFYFGLFLKKKCTDIPHLGRSGRAFLYSVSLLDGIVKENLPQ
jgi:hypothetical protein